MPYGETKVYFDGSHYIAIPHTTRPVRPKRYHVEEEIEVIDNEQEETLKTEKCNVERTLDEHESAIDVNPGDSVIKSETPFTPEISKSKKTRKATRKELFEEFYKQAQSMKKKARKAFITDSMRPYFDDEQHLSDYIEQNLQRKQRNLICRRIRMCRKANLQTFNFFCTFTYDGERHTEQSFQKGLKTALRNLCYRKGWKYMGVWERSPDKKRLHFHGLFYIPEGTIPGSLIECNDYSFAAHKRQITVQSVYFIEKFGRNDFVQIDTVGDKMKLLGYIIKYLEKSGERIVYSKGLPQFFISDIMDDDVVCPIGMEDQKLLLFDDFLCWDEGCLVGQVSPEVIAQMRTAN
jgi:hypothetical protein